MTDVNPIVAKMRERRSIPETVRHYLARMGMNRNNMEWEGEEAREEIRYPVAHLDPGTEEDIAYYVRMLPLVVPGLRVTRSGWWVPKYGKTGRGSVWFTWSREAMRARYQEVFEEFGVADERLAYMTCSGKVERPRPQRRLPGLDFDVEPQIRQAAVADRVFAAAYTVGGLKTIDSEFCTRICHPDRGGPDAIWFSQRRVVMDDEWWLVGSRGDSLEVMEIEIQASPLDDRTKENLLYNLRNYREKGLTDG